MSAMLSSRKRLLETIYNHSLILEQRPEIFHSFFLTTQGDLCTHGLFTVATRDLIGETLIFDGNSY